MPEIVAVPLMPEIDSFIDDILAKENSKRTDPNTWMTKAAFVNIIVRDWYIQSILPRVQNDASQQFARAFSDRYKTFLSENSSEKPSG